MRGWTGMAAICAGLAVAGGAAMADGHTSEFAGTKGNLVADDSLGSKGYVPPQAGIQPGYRGHLIYRHRSERRGSGPLFHVPACPANFNGMFRGTLYCVDGRPISG